MHWQMDGAYLCVKVERVQVQRLKKKKDAEFKRRDGENEKKLKYLGTTFELFRLDDRDVPIETLEIKERVFGFFWEPYGHR